MQVGVPDWTTINATVKHATATSRTVLPFGQLGSALRLGLGRLGARRITDAAMKSATRRTTSSASAASIATTPRTWARGRSLACRKTSSAQATPASHNATLPGSSYQMGCHSVMSSRERRTVVARSCQRRHPYGEQKVAIEHAAPTPPMKRIDGRFASGWKYSPTDQPPRTASPRIQPPCRLAQSAKIGGSRYLAGLGPVKIRHSHASNSSVHSWGRTVQTKGNEPNTASSRLDQRHGGDAFLSAPARMRKVAVASIPLRTTSPRDPGFWYATPMNNSASH